MKKGLSLVLVSILAVLTTGCGKTEKMTCTKDQKVGVVNLNQKIEYTIKDGYATESTLYIKAEFTNEESAETFSKNYSEEKDYKVELNGSTVNITSTETVDKDSAKADVNKKENVKKTTEAEGFTCK